MSQHPAHSQNYRHEDAPPADDIERALRGADYPTTKEKLIALAKSNGADGEVLAVFEKMTNHHFDSVDAVMNEVKRDD